MKWNRTDDNDCNQIDQQEKVRETYKLKHDFIMLSKNIILANALETTCASLMNNI